MDVHSERWFKSSYSGPEGNECLEARRTARGLDVRDSKALDRPLIAIGAGAWQACLTEVQGRHPEN